MAKKRVYYAHCVALYGTPQEQRDEQLLEAMGFFVFNPNKSDIAAAVGNIKKQPGVDYMTEVFKPLVLGQHVLAFRALPDGSIPAGVAREISWALEAKMPVFELPSGILRRGLTVSETREYLAEVGQR